MRRRPLFWQLYPSYLLMVALSLLLVVVYGSGALRTFFYQRTEADLLARAWLLEEQIVAQLPDVDQIPPDQLLSRTQAVDALCKRLGSKSLTRITIVLPSGQVIGDSEAMPAEMDRHDTREEIRHALAGQTWSSIRPSPTLDQKMMYLAIPIRRQGATIGALRTSLPVTAIDTAVGEVQRKIAVAGVVVVLIAAGVSLYVSRRLSRPLEQLKRAAEQLAQGDFSARLSGGDSLEVAAMAETINRMAADLEQRVRTVVRERNQREAMLASMVEGVLAVDCQHHLIRLNEAGAQLLGVKVENALGHKLMDVVRDSRLASLVDDVLSRGEPIEDEITLEEGSQERFLHVQGTVLRDVGVVDSEELRTGVLVVLHDVTRLRRLESVRRDFVANVSHELKTPITSIKGFVETLLDGAMERPEDAQRFLRIVAAQADRLNEIIEDLLTLSRLERDTERAGISLQRGRIREVLEAAAGVCELRACEHGVRIELTCEEQLEAEINPALLEQAVVNLVDNAVKYSPEGATVHLQAARQGNEVVISVQDHGCGISPEHLPRLFERFYRVDKARSRKLGGTGLGLAIVKHIAQAHRGRTAVESTPGQGSTFALHFPD